MANQWFRLYAEFSTDPKVQSMPEHMQRRLIMLFCWKCSQESVTSQSVAVTSRDVTVTNQVTQLVTDEDELSFHWRISEEELAETKALFLRKRLIDENWNLLNWDKRQFRSDSSAERTRKYRENKKNHDKNTPKNVVTKCDVTATPPDTDTDTDKQEREMVREAVSENSKKVETEILPPAEPDPIPNEPQERESTIYDPAPEEVMAIASRVCLAFKGAGMLRFNSFNQQLLDLIAAGVSERALISAGIDAVEKRKGAPFEYALTAAKNRHEEALRAAENPIKTHTKQSQAGGSIHEKRAHTIAELTGANRSEAEFAGGHTVDADSWRAEVQG